jgi:hypothetical protein
MVIFSFHQINSETVALSQPMIDEQIFATWMERPSTQCVAMCTLIDSGYHFKKIIVSTNCKFHKFEHSCDGFLDQLRNRLIVLDGFCEIRIDGSAEAKQDNITQQFRVISRSILNEKLIRALIID